MKTSILHVVDDKPTLTVQRFGSTGKVEHQAHFPATRRHVFTLVESIASFARQLQRQPPGGAERARHPGRVRPRRKVRGAVVTSPHDIPRETMDANQGRHACE